MTLTVSNKSLESHKHSYENSNNTKEEAINVLPEKLIFEIFSYLNYVTRGDICCTSKAWKKLTDKYDSLPLKVVIHREPFKNNSDSENFDKPETDPIKILPSKLFFNIFECLDETSLARMGCLSPAWKEFTYDTYHWPLYLDRREDNLCENFNITKQDPIEILSDEIVLESFSYLNLAELGSACCVAKAWKVLASKDILWNPAIHREIAYENYERIKKFGGVCVFRDILRHKSFVMFPQKSSDNSKTYCLKEK